MPKIDSDLFRRWNQCVSKLTGLTDVSYIPEYLMQALEVLVPSDIGLVIICWIPIIVRASMALNPAYIA